MDNNYKNFKENITLLISDIKNQIKLLNQDLITLKWKNKLTEEQYNQFLNGEIELNSPLNREDIILSRYWNYKFDVGEIVKLDWDLLNEMEKERFNSLKDLHAVIINSHLDLHAFGRGSIYSHQLRFSNGVTSPTTPLMLNPETMTPINIPSYALISISEEEYKFYKNEYKNKPYEDLWWYVKDGR